MCCAMLSCFNHAQPFATRWTVACQVPLSMGFSRQEYWSGLPCPPPGDLPDPGMERVSLASPAMASGFFTTSSTWEAQCVYTHTYPHTRHLYSSVDGHLDCCHVSWLL